MTELRAIADTEHWRAIAPLRRERPRWFGVNWHSGADEYQAWPRFRAPAGTITTGRTPAELAAAMDLVEQACRERLESAS